MIFSFFPGFESAIRAAVARNLHSTWLTKALRSGSKLPRIPTRLVRDGGFDRERSTPAGRRWAEDWWNTTLQNPDLD